MQKAGWVLADELTLRSGWGMVKAALTCSSYPAAPVSDLYLLDRRQDFAYQQEVGGNVAARHHVRFWKVPDGWILPGGEKVEWLAAGSYDRAVGFSVFTIQFTHKIDADIDRERDYIISTLRYADPRITVHTLEDFSTSYHSYNGGGDAVRTDGDLPIVDVTGTAPPDFTGHPDSDTGAHDPGDHHLPPPSLLLAGLALGLISVFFAVFGIATWLGYGHVYFWGEHLIAADRIVGGGLFVAAAAIGMVVIIGAFKRGRIARILLMLLASFSAFAALGSIGDMGLNTVRFWDVTLAMLAIIILLGLTSTSARRWTEDKPRG